jgi:hypothetical protein
MTVSFAAASGKNGGGGGAAPPPSAGNVVPGQAIIRESFGAGSDLMRPSGGNGTMKPVFIGTDISSFWSEAPGNATEIWAAPGGKQVQTWFFTSSSVNPKEAPSPLDNASNSNGTLTVSAGADNPAALLPFTPPAIPYEVSVDVAQQPRTATDWVAVGFTSSNAVTHNFESSGQAWISMRIENPQVDFYHVVVELHTNGAAGQSVSGNFVLTSFDTMTVRYDPVNKTVTGLFNGAIVGTIPYAAAGINHVGVEADAPLGIITVDNFNVKASN